MSLGDSEMKFGSFDGGQKGEYDGIGFARMSKIFATWNVLFFAVLVFDIFQLQ